MFAPFAAFLQDQGPLVLGLALPAAALLLLALALLAEQRPGAAVSRVDRRRAGGIALAVAMALPLAMAGFWLFPRLSSPIWGLPENALGRSGLGESGEPGGGGRGGQALHDGAARELHRLSPVGGGGADCSDRRPVRLCRVCTVLVQTCTPPWDFPGSFAPGRPRSGTRR